MDDKDLEKDWEKDIDAHSTARTLLKFLAAVLVLGGALTGGCAFVLLGFLADIWPLVWAAILTASGLLLWWVLRRAKPRP